VTRLHRRVVAEGADAILVDAREHLVAGGKGRDLAADLGHHPRQIIAQDDRHRRRAQEPQSTLAQLEVDRVHARGVDLNKHVPAGDRRARQLPKLDDFIFAVLADKGSSHGSSLLFAEVPGPGPRPGNQGTGADASTKRESAPRAGDNILG